MTTLTENNLQELKEFIGGQLKEVDGKIDKLSEQVNGKIDRLSEQVNGKMDKLSEQVDSKIDRLSEQVNGKMDKLSEQVSGIKVDLGTVKGELTGINKRLDNLEFTNRTIFVAIVAALMAGLVKLFFPNLPNNP